MLAHRTLCFCLLWKGQMPLIECLRSWNEMGDIGFPDLGFEDYPWFCPHVSHFGSEPLQCGEAKLMSYPFLLPSAYPWLPETKSHDVVLAPLKSAALGNNTQAFWWWHQDDIAQKSQDFCLWLVDHPIENPAVFSFFSSHEWKALTNLM